MNREYVASNPATHFNTASWKSRARGLDDVEKAISLSVPMAWNANRRLSPVDESTDRIMRA